MNNRYHSIVKGKTFFKRVSSQYLEEQKYSSNKDDLFSFAIKDIEEDLVSVAKENNPQGNYKTWGPEQYDGHQAWIGLSPEQLQTTYSEFYEICEYLNNHYQESDSFKVIDFGAAYGRLGLVLPLFFPKAIFEGYEIVKERVEKTNKVYKELGLDNSKLFSVNVLSFDFKLPKAQVYFIYDIGEYEHIKSLIDKIESLYDNGERFILIARGRGVNSVLYKHHPWMENVFTGFFKSYSIYNCL